MFTIRVRPEDEAVEVGGTGAVLGGFGQIAEGLGAEADQFRPLLMLWEHEGAALTPEWRAEIAGLIPKAEARRARIGRLGVWLLRRLRRIIEPPNAGELSIDIVEASAPPAWVAEAARVNAVLVEPMVERFKVGLEDHLRRVAAKTARFVAQRKVWPASTFTDGIDRFEPFYRDMVERSYEDSRMAAKAASAKVAYGGYKYGTVDASGVLRIDIPALTTARMELVDESLLGLDAKMADFLRRSASKGMTADELGRAMAGQWADAMGSYPEKVARAEVGSTVAVARVGAMLSAGAGQAMWVSFRDDRVRDTHQRYDDGKVRKVGFNYARLSRGRYTLRWPFDDECEELDEIFGCRCVLVSSDSVGGKAAFVDMKGGRDGR